MSREVVSLLIDNAKSEIDVLDQKVGDREKDQFSPPVKKWGIGGLGVIFLGGITWS